MDISGMLDKLIPITKFNQGQASKYFSKVHDGETFVVMKNNAPISIIVSPEEYSLLKKIESTCQEAVSNPNMDLLKCIAPFLTELQSLDSKESN